MHAILGWFMCCAAAVAAEPWADISAQLFAQAPGYDDTQPGGRRVGGLAVDRHTGDLLVCLNGPPFGVWKSADTGSTWARIDGGNVAGGWVRSYSVCLDQDRPGRLAVYRMFPPQDETVKDMQRASRSALTIDGGATWTVMIAQGPNYGVGGWMHGTAWWDDSGARMLMAQSRAKRGIFLSTDQGASWIDLKLEPVIEGSLAIGIAQEQERAGGKVSYPTTRGYGVVAGALLKADAKGIHRSTDQGKTWTRVSDLLALGYCPVAGDGRLLWAGERGILVSTDQGQQWAVLGADLPGACKGPFLGRTPADLVTVTAQGVFRTADAGAHWRKISGLYDVADAWRADDPPEWRLRHTDYAWDPTRNIVYVAGFAGSAYRLQVKD